MWFFKRMYFSPILLMAHIIWSIIPQYQQSWRHSGRELQKRKVSQNMSKMICQQNLTVTLWHLLFIDRILCLEVSYALTEFKAYIIVNQWNFTGESFHWTREQRKYKVHEMEWTAYLSGHQVLLTNISLPGAKIMYANVGNISKRIVGLEQGCPFWRSMCVWEKKTLCNEC